MRVAWHTWRGLASSSLWTSSLAVVFGVRLPRALTVAFLEQAARHATRQEPPRTAARRRGRWRRPRRCDRMAYYAASLIPVVHPEEGLPARVRVRSSCSSIGTYLSTTPRCHHFLKLTIADRIRHVPADVSQDYIPFKTTAFELDHRMLCRRTRWRSS
jgi:hypothetical protein